MDDSGYGDPRWEQFDPHAAYLSQLPDPEPLPEWMAQNPT
jgi:hypothetical protein